MDLIKHLLRIHTILTRLGFDLRALCAIRHLPQYYFESRKFVRMGGQIDSRFMVLKDYQSQAGTAKGHFFIRISS